MPQRPFPDELIRRVRRAYLDRPELSLTAAEARRTFGADRVSCALALRALLDTGLLTRRDDGRFVRTQPRSARDAMKRRQPPWDCRWAEPARAGAWAPWMNHRTTPHQPAAGSAGRNRRAASPHHPHPMSPSFPSSTAQWTCLREGGPTELEVERCLACPQWEPLLATRRIARGRRTTRGT